VRGPLGAAYLSLRRIGWAFLTPFQLVTAEGVTINLTDTAPAMVAYRLRLAWDHQRLQGAQRSLHLDASLKVDFEAARKNLLDRRIPARERGVLHRYLTHTPCGRASACTT
jgi:hypothetical protein